MSDTPIGVGTSAGLGPLPARWYCLTRDGLATLCKDKEDAQANARHCELTWPAGGPYRVALLGDVAAERERWQRIATTAQAVTTGSEDKIDLFEVPSHLMAALAMALDDMGQRIG